ncbi:Myeloid-derived growth factor [Porphyridium purpureum]|uniref:Myeloid-derived growth factor n=1 Tax=Porphyridium purpureum TaxID=35688 RepID=A0A5J4Z1L3_PORPP|nr:Myeloid-derived growth factor [Porphyridium purpureum]|eukprot:POR2617..scf208_2
MTAAKACMPLLIVILSFVLLAVSLVSADEPEARRAFKIVPGQAGSVSVSLNTPPVKESTCTFSHQTRGATPEEWELEIRGDPSSGEMFCSVGRASATQTYLMFEGFKLHLGTADLADVIVFDNEGKPLPDDQYEVRGAQVSSVSGWNGQFVGAEIVALLNM